MPTPAAESHPGAGGGAKEVAGHAGTLVRRGLELARLEVKSKAAAIGLGVGAAVVALYALGFLLATIAVALAIVLDAWLALLLVTLGLFAIVGILAWLARARLSSDSSLERRELDAAVEQLREDLDDATALSDKLQSKLPVVAASALGAGFFLAGGIGATMRLFARKSRER